MEVEDPLVLYSQGFNGRKQVLKTSIESRLECRFVHSAFGQ